MPKPSILNYSKTVAVILAGGHSRRMGSCKTKLRWRGNTLLCHQQNLIDALELPCFVSGPYGIADSTRDCGHDKKSMPEPQGPLHGIATCLEKIPAERLLFIPVDMPLLTVAALRALIGGGTRYHACYFQNFPLPCLISNTQENMKTAICLASAPGRKRAVKYFLKTISATAIPPTIHELSLKAQANTPDDWSALQMMTYDLGHRKYDRFDEKKDALNYHSPNVEK